MRRQARPRIQSIHARREEGAEVTDESVTCDPGWDQGERRRAGAPVFPPAIYCLFRDLICWALICSTSVSTSSGVSLLAYFGMRPLPLLMILRRSSAEVATVLSETRDGPPKWRPSAVFP